MFGFRVERFAWVFDAFEALPICWLLGSCFVWVLEALARAAAFLYGCLAKEGVICLRADAGHVLACVCLRLALARGGV